MEKLGDQFISKEGKVETNNLKDMQLVGLYFGAQYCSPHLEFYPKLVDLYEEVNQEEKKFEVIYVGLDPKLSHFTETLNDMPWIAYDFKDQQKMKVYQNYKHDIPGIPCLIIINPTDGKVLTNQGRGQVEKELNEAFDGWMTKLQLK